jgi:diamine N-acetyltransferase
MDVSLREITADNVRAVCELRVAEDQRKLVAPAAYTIAESAYEPGGMLRAIYLGDKPVGVLWVDGINKDVPYIVRLLVDTDHQRQGIGRQAIEAVISDLQGRGASAVSVSYVDAPGGAEAFWRACGFEPTGEVRHREQIARRSLGS